jgi:GH18 family chitinase
MTSGKYVMYLTGLPPSILSRGTYANVAHRQHNVVPEASLVSEITHVALAFMSPAVFNNPDVSDWPFFTTVEKVRSQFAKGTAVMVAIGGWGDTRGFSEAAATERSRKLFAKNVNAMVEQTGADGKFQMHVKFVDCLLKCLGVDIDWEYPG